MLSINWPLVLITTVVLYALTIVYLPFNAVYATVFLFTLISFWSRLPGVGIVHPFFLLYNTDLVDLFALIITINLGPSAGIALIVFGNLWPRVCGVHPPWGAVITDTASMSIVALFIPFIHSATGGNIFVSMTIFTLIRAALWQPLDLIFWPQAWASIGQQIILILINVPTIFIINGFYAKVFGSFFDNLMQKGVAFSWPLFFFATIVILIFYISVFGKSKSIGIGASIGKIVKRRIKKARQMKIDDRDRVIYVQGNSEVEDMRDIQRFI